MRRAASPDEALPSLACPASPDEAVPPSPRLRCLATPGCAMPRPTQRSLAIPRLRRLAVHKFFYLLCGVALTANDAFQPFLATLLERTGIEAVALGPFVLAVRQVCEAGVLHRLLLPRKHVVLRAFSTALRWWPLLH